ncbi:DUF1634 domain-containing protein [Desulfolutivibrio sulfoxidireducens]|uniref:DUF1634 domain-containing protein n=1 Tax=Desulfolutivibrio sulfoxidireducens TaxID=2773299 RepID=UPI00159D2908|nr:DUF1634 domain-containing protein [Desulfolutivibrio sulfoxidireducens]QLA16133.1 DUF1634 domain-containing protein [Desulfolutivibrio sulfoxidireducens]QLA19970.1 DUF1634 domain-containing protein [Desulfolutivibrio sulfoxidireducens]
MTSSKYDKTPKEQVLYATMLFYGCWGGLALMTVIYLIYVFGILDPQVPMATILELWSKPVHEYLTIGHVPVGWGWAGLLGKGDFLNFLGIALLAGLTLVCYIPLVLAYLKKKDMLFAVISAAEILVLAFAASGIVGGGGH